MRQLVFTGPRATEWVDAPDPTLTTPTGALVEPTVVSTCDMDAVALSGMIRFRPGTPLGHEGIGVVVEVGEGAFDPTSIASVHPFDDTVDALAEPFTKLIFRRAKLQPPRTETGRQTPH
jgi:hypothetical protein